MHKSDFFPQLGTPVYWGGDLIAYFRPDSDGKGVYLRWCKPILPGRSIVEYKVDDSGQLYPSRKPETIHNFYGHALTFAGSLGGKVTDVPIEQMEQAIIEHSCYWRE